uniref:ATP synthase complex subunit 8 n=1 Tax=Shelfordella lateralis TaxID=36981 RepID=A0A146AFK1_SHELA|nr:ATP synthase F0 subunit 8 [Periplaneta lateralis]AMW91069.1 ATP synthase F0 subunit 8 [Periplaneta lateralis]AVN67789.1 ATP synthase F0 subunit 8 [Periplaneta lateralis]UEV86525.1 ATP synthase F0 subunit 8 [Periplaneta lateralis]
MPQMMPLSWLMLFLFFSIMFMLFNSMNYFSYIPINLSMEKKMINSKMMNWKW